MGGEVDSERAVLLGGGAPFSSSNFQDVSLSDSPR